MEGGLELLRAQKMSKAGKRCVESFVDVTWFSKNSQEGRRVRFLERARTDWGPEELWGGADEALARPLRGGLGAGSDSLWPPHPSKS